MKVLSIFKNQQVLFFSSVTSVYGVTLLLLFACLLPYVPEPTVHASPVVYTASAPKQKKTVEKHIQTGNPVEIRIPRLELVKAIEPGIYDPNAGTWNVSDLGVHFATISSPLNDDSGNSFFYAHNNEWAFGRLYLMRPGDIIEIITDNQLLFRYEFSGSKDYEPNDTSVFTYTGPPIVTLQTCSGIFNEYRHLYTFNFIGVKEL